MQYLNTRKAIGLFMALAFFIGGSHTALAAGTASNTSITNTATVDYDVGGDARSASGSDAGFVVDNRVDLTVVNTDAGNNVNVSPASTNRVLTYTVTNTGNTAQGYQFDYEPAVPTVMTNVRIYVDDPDSGTIGSWDASDPQYIVGATGNFASLFSGTEFTVEGTANQGLNHDNGSDGTTSVTVFIVADTPAGATNGQTENYNLLATTLNSGTNVVTTEPVGPTAGVDAVFADIAGTYTGDSANDGRHSATGSYTVQSALLTAAKTITNVNDEFNGDGGFSIPNSVVRYGITITSGGTGTVDADSVIVSDPIPANTKLCFAAGTRCTAADLPTFTPGASGLVAPVGGFEYSNDNGTTWTYSPTADAQGADTNITNVRIAPTGTMANATSFTVTIGVVIE